ncbi:non-homologous end-joining DNA ligase [Nannocystis pusilla]|uniref:Non-homologous end-joining DNA ligase n=1 Tax=Nannocystis pusilla TaxID=889268 RepID=A0ABS7TIM0_9BACT|nr:non-homologous end-joining DNA ligase [Nannocystis pusilla]MBZ5708055.1 non-homologous end-joining DNA ligase [Nannocystis pusilla]
MGKAITTLEVDGQSIEVTSPNKLLYPDEQISKGELVDYYRDVAGFMVPHLTGRPLTLHCFPSGIAARGYFQKAAQEHFPAYVHRLAVASHSGETVYAVADNAAALVFLASQNCLVFHPCHVLRDRLDRPDLVIIDLDPSDDDFAKVRHGARLLRDLLPALGLVPFVKTTGSRGLHVVAPIYRELDCDGVSEFARKVAQYLVATDPMRFTMDINKKKRGDRVFVDYLRNGQAQTAVAPYSARALPRAPVAAPIGWDELDDPELDARRWHIRNVRERLRDLGDPWGDIHRHARSLADAAEALANL